MHILIFAKTHFSQTYLELGSYKKAKNFQIWFCFLTDILS